MTQILADIQVIDLSRYLAAPLCASILADMGATVYKIERPGAGDENRHLGPFRKDAQGRDTELSAAFMAGNRGKQSVTIDITRPEGAQLVRELAARCDVLIENHKTGGLKKYGLDYESLRAVKPDIVYCSVTGFGQDGPYASRPAFDSVIQAMSGLMSLCGQADGTPGGEPMRSQALLSDTTAGLYAAIAVMGALYHRRTTGQGQRIDLGMLDASVSLCGLHAINYLMNGTVPARSGNTNPTTSPSDVLRTRNGHLLVICSTNAQFHALCRAIGRPEMIDDARYVSNATRIEHRASMREAIETALMTRTTTEWVAIFEAAGVACGAINDMERIFDDPQVKHRELRVDVPYGDGPAVPVLRSPMRFSETPVVHGGPPVLGEYTDRVLGEVLGRSREQIESLRAAKVI